MDRLDYLLETPDKVFVAVNVDHFPDGTILPCSILWGERRIPIDRITGTIPAATRKSGGAGLRFTIHIGRHTRYLFLEGDSPENARYFVERGEPE